MGDHELQDPPGREDAKKVPDEAQRNPGFML
jgi:hypothetical protein